MSSPPSAEPPTPAPSSPSKASPRDWPPRSPTSASASLVEPGPFRTDFAGRSATHATPIDDYAPVLDPARAQFHDMNGTQPGDPTRAAQAILTLVDMDDPPLRLPLGPAAFDRIRDRLHSRLADLDRTEPLGRDTDFQPAPAT